MRSQPKPERSTAKKKSAATHGGGQQEVAPTAPLSPEEYNVVIQNLTPMDVRLIASMFSLRAPIHSGPLMTHAKFHEPVLNEPIEKGPDGEVFAMVDHHCDFIISASDGAIAADGQAVYRVRIRVAFNPPIEFWQLFLRRNIKLYTHPAVRDFIASLAARASLITTPLSSISVTQNIQKAE